MDWTYWLGRLFGRFVFLCTMRTSVIGAHHAQRDGGYILALTHLSHIEPMAAGIISRRYVDWMTRKEFYKYRPIALCLKLLNCFCVDRQGIPVRAVRTAIQRVQAGRVVGICPEGGVKIGAESALRGGPIKRGVASVAIRAAAPIIPCVMIGTDKLNHVRPWLPFKRAKIWVAYGEAIHPPPGIKSTRQARRELTQRLSAAYQTLYAQLRQTYGIPDSFVS